MPVEMDGEDFSLLMAFARESAERRADPVTLAAYSKQMRTHEAREILQDLVPPGRPTHAVLFVCRMAGVPLPSGTGTVRVSMA